MPLHGPSPPLLVRQDWTANTEYLVYKICRYVETGNNIRYVVRWFEYAQLEDTTSSQAYPPKFYCSISPPSESQR